MISFLVTHPLRMPFLILVCKLAVVLFRSTEHQNCGPQPGFVRASIESNLPSAFQESVLFLKKKIVCHHSSFFLNFILVQVEVSRFPLSKASMGDRALKFNTLCKLMLGDGA
jgi:hypothetical protein